MFGVEPLRARHETTAFTCGNQELDRWLAESALGVAGHGTRTYVVAEERSNRIVGCFAIAPHLLRSLDPPPRVARGAPRLIPAILLAKLALHKDLHGRGLGAELLIRALEVIVAAARRAGGRLVVVDAIDEPARNLYRHHGFDPLPSRDDRLILKLSTAARSLGADWP